MDQARHPSIDAAGLRIGLIISRFNEPITTRLRDGARAALRECGTAESDISEYWVPGAFELPLAAQALARSGQFDALVCLGCVVRGETTHHEHVGGEAARGIARVSLEHNFPIGFGVLTTNTMEQAKDRAGGASGNKGADAAISAVEMVHFLRGIGATRPRS